MVTVDANAVVGRCDILLLVLDTLRYDVAVELLAAGETPQLAALIGPDGWERRHSPGSFTYSAHQAFFAGFLPTPATPGSHERLFAVRFDGSETTSDNTCVFDAPDIVTGLAARGYHTACVGGVGFFNRQNPLGRVLPSLFLESHWSPELGVTDRQSTRHQIDLASKIVARTPAEKLLFLFLNISALHQPNYFYLPAAEQPPDRRDTRASHAAALAHVDSQLPPLIAAMARRRRRWFCIVCSDHGTAYGEDGYFGHRVAHPVVWTVPYAQRELPAERDR